MKHIILVCLIIFSFSTFAEDGFTQADRERAIRTEVTLQEFMKSTDKRFEAVDKRFEALDKRFEAIDKRFDDMITFLTIIISVFAAAVGGMYLYIMWDRRTFMNTALLNAKELIDVQLNEVQKEGKLVELIKAMRELAKDDPKVKSVLMRFHLL